MDDIQVPTPSEFYRARRPEYFSDSEIIYEAKLLKEQLNLELEQITTNQKEAEFETLCRRLAEKTITPNLIPQVGPTGGGDGKTDSETHSVSEYISDRWFIPKNGWDNNEKWAFAFSAKKTWKVKVENDIKNILSTNREYTKIFFITNQTPSSKAKKDAEDELRKKYNIDIKIFDRTWILEKTYNNNLIEVVVKSLNLSTTLLPKVIVGSYDAGRIKKLEELEENINNPNRYTEFDHQLVEDALESALLSRMLNKPRDEIEGKFDRALRFCKKLKNEKQLMRIHYQRAWTYLYYFDDYSAFIGEYIEFKNYITSVSHISQIGLYFNLFTALKASIPSIANSSDLGINLLDEQKKLYEILDNIILDGEATCSSLIAKSYKILHEVVDNNNDEQTTKHYLTELSNTVLSGAEYIDFPFLSLKKIIEEIGIIFPNEPEFDNLIDIVVSISAKRSSELEAGKTFIKRGFQKLDGQFYKESIIYFSKSISRLSKNESKDILFIVLQGLACAYSEMGLIWAANNCLILASSTAIRPWYEKGIVDYRLYECIKRLAINELFIGRVPIFLTWHELLQIIIGQLNMIESKDREQIPIIDLLDACLATRLMNTDLKNDSSFSLLPDLLEQQKLWMAQDTCLFQLGHTELINPDMYKINSNVEDELNQHFVKVAQQPFTEQILYATDLCTNDKLQISSKILGCMFNLSFKKNIELLLAAETLLAFFESFLATTSEDVYPHTELINIEIVQNSNIELINISIKEQSNEYLVEINQFNFQSQSRKEILDKLLSFTIQILTGNFIIREATKFLENLFSREEVHERVNFIFEHRNLTLSIIGSDPKLFFDKWTNDRGFKAYSNKRTASVSYDSKPEEKLNEDLSKFSLDKASHKNRVVSSIINIPLWDRAKWNSFGFCLIGNELNILLAFENYIAGKSIFNNWKDTFGPVDKDEQIRITIIKNINKNHPYCYRVCIGSNIDKTAYKSGTIVSSPLIVQDIYADSPKNLNDLIDHYNHIKIFRLCPAEMPTDENKMIDSQNNGILKQQIIVREAWEIGLNDPECIAIKKDDSPIISDSINNAPILEILAMLNK